VIGKELRKAREAAGLTQEEVAFRAHISREYLGQLEREQKSPTVQVFVRVCKAMKISAAQLLGRVERLM
jgi:transcriptional regulator with XRE-family HTH domain